MKSARVIPMDDLPVLLTGKESPVWWAVILLVVIEVTVFATLISSYFYLGLMLPEWPPPDVEPPGLMLPLINTGVLLVSTLMVYVASRGIKQGKQRQLKVALGVAVLMETVFLVIKILASGGIEHSWDDHVYASIFWMINRLHTGHVLVAILMGLVAEVLALKGYFTRERRVGIEVVNIYFQFVAFVWIPVLLVLFLLPRWT